MEGRPNGHHREPEINEDAVTDIRPIRNEDDYTWALAEIEQYFEAEPEPGTTEGDRFDLLALVIEDYERKHWVIEPADAPDVIAARIEDAGTKRKDLIRLLGSKSRASEFLNRQRYLTMDQVRALHGEWRIPLEVLVKPYELRKKDKFALEKNRAAM
jgi:HTH-type transcriptional regulator/antitoxin HigA